MAKYAAKKCKTSGATSDMLKKSKMHPKYRKVFSENTVKVLRRKARSAGAKKWYSLRKGNLVGAIVVHDSAVTVTNVFREMMDKKRDRVIQAHVLNGSTCPISLTPVSELTSDDIFVHGGAVFSRGAILDYLEATADFRNPITRNMMHLHDVERLRCKDALDKYFNRSSLRFKKISSIRQFAFLETELEHLLMSLVQQYYVQDTPFFENALVAFKQTWKAMKFTDRNRTTCVLNSLKQTANRFQGKPRLWGLALVANYLRKTQQANT